MRPDIERSLELLECLTPIRGREYLSFVIRGISSKPRGRDLRPTGKEIPIRCNQWVKQICAIGIALLLVVTTSVGAVAKPDLAKLVAQPAELSAWAYAYRSDLKV